MMPQEGESDLRAEEGIPVEVKLLDNGGYYDAFLMNVCEDEALIHFPMNWKEETKFPLSLIRFPPDKDAEKVEMKENMVAEAYLHKQPGIYKGWFQILVKAFKSKFCQFEYPGDHSGVDFVTKDMIRPFNDKPSLSWNMFHVHVVSIPEEIQEYASRVGVHNGLKVAIKGALINYDSNNHKLIIISTNQADITRAQVLEKAHLRSLAQKTRVLQLTGKLDRQIERTENGEFVEEFTVNDSLIGSAIGKEKANLRAAKNIEGISYVQFVRKYNKFIIYGETEKAVSEARELLEIRKEYYFIPESEMSQLVGRNSENIYAFVEATGVVEIFIPKTRDVPENCRREGFLPLAVVGTSKAINRAKVCIDYQLDHIHEVSDLRKKRIKLNQDIIDYFKNSSSISTDSRTDITVSNSEVVQLTTESASPASEHEYPSGEVQEISLQVQIEAKRQLDNLEDATGFQGEKPNALTETEPQICDCRDDSDTSEKSLKAYASNESNLNAQTESLKSSASDEAQQITREEEINNSDIGSIPEVEDMHLETIALNTTRNEADTTTPLYTSTNTQIPENEMQFPQPRMPIYSASACNLHPQYPPTVFLDLPVEPPPLTYFPSMARTLITFDNRIYSDTSRYAYTIHSHLQEITYPHQGYSVTSTIVQMQNLLIKMPSSNFLNIASSDMQIIEIEAPSRNPPNLTSGGVQITEIEEASSNPPSKNPLSLASGDMQITEIEAPSSNPPSRNPPNLASGDWQIPEIEAPTSNSPRSNLQNFASGDMQIITVIEAPSSNPPSSNSPRLASGNLQITEIEAPSINPLIKNPPSLASDDMQITDIKTLSSNPPSLASEDLQITEIEAPISNPPSLASSDDLQITKIEAPSSNPPSSNSPRLASGNMQITEIEAPSSNPPSRNSLDLASGDWQITEIEAPSSNPLSSNSPNFASGDMQITVIESSSINPPSRNLSSFAADMQITEIEAPSSNPPGLASDDLKITKIKAPSSNLSSFASRDMQINTVIEAPSSNPPSSNSPRLASGDLQITEIGAPSSNSPTKNPPSLASGDMQITEIEASSSNPPGSNLPRFASGDMQITAIETPSNNPPSSNPSSFASADREITFFKTLSNYLLFRNSSSSNSLNFALGDTQITQAEAPSTKITKEWNPPKPGYLKKMRLIDLLQRIGYDGPMLDEPSFKMAIKIGLKSPDYNQLIIYLTEEIHKFKEINQHITPMTKPSNSNIFSTELEQFLREINCPYSELLASEISSRLQTSSRRRMVVRFLAIEVICNRLLHNSEQLKEVENYMIKKNLEFNVNTMLKILKIPIAPSEDTFLAMERVFFNCVDKHSSESSDFSDSTNVFEVSGCLVVDNQK